jgi:hypothetical protein
MRRISDDRLIEIANFDLDTPFGTCSRAEIA